MVADIHDMTYDQQSDADINSPQLPGDSEFKILKSQFQSLVHLFVSKLKATTTMLRLLLLLGVILYASSHFAAGEPVHGHRHRDPDPRRRHLQHKYFHLETNSNESTVLTVPVTDNIENTERRDGFEIHYSTENNEEIEKPDDSEDDEEHETSQEPHAEGFSKGEGDERTSSWIRYLMASLAVGLLIGVEIAG
jgi:hypothetical protein